MAPFLPMFHNLFQFFVYFVSFAICMDIRENSFYGEMGEIVVVTECENAN